MRLVHAVSTAFAMAFFIGCGTTPPASIQPEDASETTDAAIDAPLFDRSIEIDTAALLDQGMTVDAKTVADARVSDENAGGCPPPTTRCGDACVNLSSDPHHCGACATDCTTLPGVDSARVLCAASACNPLSGCLAGRTHCSTNPADGCEVDLSTPAHCGSCATSCSEPTPLCSRMEGGDAGTSTYRCTSGCTGMTPTRCGGTCVDAQTDVRHCGACGRACAVPPGGATTCVSGACRPTCPSGRHLCSEACVANTEITSCGALCTACPVPSNSMATCDGTTCGSVCLGGFHRCGGACVSSLSADSCGSSCTPCPAPPANANATCVGGVCGFACNAGFHLCAGACVSDASPASCGSACTPCATASNGVATCSGGICGATCNAGFHACAGVCASNASPASCGARCTPCTAPANATATCDGVTCGFVCNPTYFLQGGSCLPSVPRQVAPMSTSVVTSRRPVFSSRPAEALDGARVELCRNRAMTVSCLSLDTTFGVGVPSADLGQGTWFWRLRGLAGAVASTATSPVWEFFVGVRSASVNTASGSVLDTNGDGLADILVGTDYDNGAFLFLGTPAGVETAPRVSLIPARRGGNFGRVVANAGDVNGDGFGDAIVGGGEEVAYVYLGSADGLAANPAVTLAVSGSLFFGAAVAGVGDVNRDGYGDVIVGAHSSNSAYVFHGGPSGPGTTPAATLAGPSFANLGISVAGAGDVNGDGYADIIVGSNVTRGPFVNSAFIYHGGNAGVGTTPALRITGANDGNFGFSVDGAGDVNADGYSDVIVGAYQGNNFQGDAYVYLGSSGGINAGSSTRLAVAGSYYFGFSVSGAGDVNADGYADVVVGQRNGSAVYVYRGSGTGIGSSPTTTLQGATSGNFGFSVGGAGDMDGDGYADVVVGEVSLFGVGSVRGFPGSAAGTRITAWPTIPSPFGVMYFGFALSRSR